MRSDTNAKYYGNNEKLEELIDDLEKADYNIKTFLENNQLLGKLNKIPDYHGYSVNKKDDIKTCEVYFFNNHNSYKMIQESITIAEYYGLKVSMKFRTETNSDWLIEIYDPEGLCYNEIGELIVTRHTRKVKESDNKVGDELYKIMDNNKKYTVTRLKDMNDILDSLDYDFKTDTVNEKINEINKLGKYYTFKYSNYLLDELPSYTEPNVLEGKKAAIDQDLVIKTFQEDLLLVYVYQMMYGHVDQSDIYHDGIDVIETAFKGIGLEDNMDLLKNVTKKQIEEKIEILKDLGVIEAINSKKGAKKYLIILKISISF